MEKSLVFISHIGDESEIAKEFKSLIETGFLGLIEVFVSSDGTSIQMGQKWLEDVSSSLAKCAIEIVICSPVSVKRPWINFEAGAGWVRGIPVIPLCHSGMKPSSLPVPLNLLQAASATEINSLNLIFPVLAQAIGSQTPKVDFTDFVEKVKLFEKRYTFWNHCNAAFDEIKLLHPQIISALKNGQVVETDLNDFQINNLQPHMDFLRENSILDFQRIGNTKLTSKGTYYSFNIVHMNDFKKFTSNSEFKH